MNNQAQKRFFIAFNLPEKTKKTIFKAINRLKNNSNVKWVAEKNLHITLLFLACLSQEDEKIVKLTMQNYLGRFKKMIFELIKIDFFPQIKDPNVIYVSCRQTNGNSSTNLHNLLEKNLEKSGLKIDKKKWLPHITIGRLKEGKTFKAEEAAGINFAKHSFTIDSFDLVLSELMPDGPDYKTIEKFNLID